MVAMKAESQVSKKSTAMAISQDFTISTAATSNPQPEAFPSADRGLRSASPARTPEEMAQQQPTPSQAQTSHPMLINLPQPPSNPDTPSEMPGTPTSTTTSLSALSTTAIKDGHRGALHHRGHQHSPSANSLEAERADRISRLAGLSTVTTLRSPPAGFAQQNANPTTNPTSTGFPVQPTAAAAAGGLVPAYFDAAGQPVAATKVSTVGSASETESLGGHTSTTTEGGGDSSTLGEDRDEDMLAELDSASASGYMGADAMDEDLDNLAAQSAAGYEDRMSDDGSASLVGFGEGAGSTLSGPIYHRRPLPPQTSTGAAPPTAWGLERSSSGLSEGATSLSNNPPPPHSYHSSASGRRDFAVQPPPSTERDTGTDTPVSQSAVRERREARMVDGVALNEAVGAPLSDGVLPDGGSGGGGVVFVDTTTRGPVPAAAGNTLRDRRPPHAYHHHQPQQQTLQTQQQQHPVPPFPERVGRERLDEGQGRDGSTGLEGLRGRERF